MLGCQFQDGTQMSIGQWQKMTLGRTLYRDADVYIFDEPNASLDLFTEFEILKTIRQETKEKIFKLNQLISKISILRSISMVH